MRFIRNVTYNYSALSTEVPLLFILCLKLRMCHSICSRVGVFPRYCTCKWSRFSEERRTKRTEIDWPCCIMYLFVTDISEHFKTYSCSVSARIWISNCFFTCIRNLLDRFSKPVPPVPLCCRMFTCRSKGHVMRQSRNVASVVESSACKEHAALKEGTAGFFKLETRTRIHRENLSWVDLWSSGCNTA